MIIGIQPSATGFRKIYGLILITNPLFTEFYDL